MNFEQDKSGVNLLFINPSPMPLREQKRFLDDSITTRLPDFNVPLGILDLSAYAKQTIQDINVELLDVAVDLHKVYKEMTVLGKTNHLSCSDFYSKEIESVKTIPDIVGMSISYSTSYYSALEIIRLCKQKWPNAKILCGGNHATAYYKLMLEDSKIDLVIRGEAETSLIEYIKRFQQSKTKKINIDGMKGVYDKAKATKNPKDPGEISPLLDSLDNIGIADFELLDLDFFKSASDINYYENYDVAKGSMSVMWSRGCPYKCTFCASHVVHGRMIRHKSNDLIVKELLAVKNLGFSRIAVYDDLFAGKRKKFLSLLDKMDTAGLIGDIEYHLPNSLSITVMTEKIIDGIVRMGVKYFKFSVETGSQYTQDHIILKKVDLKKCRRIIKYAQTKNKPIQAYLILGFPRETKKLMKESIDYYRTLDVDWVPIYSALPLPGSDMYKEYIDMGVITDDTYNWDANRYPLRDFDTPEIKKEELESLIYDTNISLNFLHNSNVKHGRYERAIDSWNTMVLQRYPWHVVALYCRGRAYHKMKEKIKAKKDFSKCAGLIKTDERSKKMYQRYGHEMEHLNNYLDEKEKKAFKILKNTKPESVTQFIY